MLSGFQVTFICYVYMVMNLGEHGDESQSSKSVDFLDYIINAFDNQCFVFVVCS